MSHPSHKPRPRLLETPDLYVIAAIHILTAIGLSILLVYVHFLRYWDTVELVPLLLEALLWIVPILLLAVIGVGLLTRRPWARLLAIVIHWPIFAGAILTSVFYLVVIIRYVPANGLEFSTAMMAIALPILVFVAVVSGVTLQCLYQHAI